MPTARRRVDAVISSFEIVAGAGALLWALAQVHTALAVGTGGFVLLVSNLRRTRREG